MPTPPSTYLHHHLAGSAAALDLFAHLEAARADTGPGTSFAALKADAQADHDELKALIARLGVTRGPVRWAAAKAARLKLAISDPAGGPLRRLEAVETLAVGPSSTWRPGPGSRPSVTPVPRDRQPVGGRAAADAFPCKPRPCEGCEKSLGVCSP